MEYTNVQFSSKKIIKNIEDIYIAVQKNHNVYETNAKKLFNNAVDELEKIGFKSFNDKTVKINSDLKIKRFMKINAIDNEGTGIVFLTGRAVTNNDYLISIISAGLIDGIDNLVICLFDRYKGAKDYWKVIEFSRALATSNLDFCINNLTIIELKHID